MAESNQTMWSLGDVLQRGLMVASLTLSGALLWGVGQDQDVQRTMQGAPLAVSMVCSLILFVGSLVLLPRKRRMAVYGLLVGVGGIIVCLSIPISGPTKSLNSNRCSPNRVQVAFIGTRVLERDHVAEQIAPVSPALTPELGSDPSLSRVTEL
jgi:hypothetical protein